MVKSSSIVAKRERPEVLSPELKSKVERYVVFWRKESDGTGPSTPRSVKELRPRPGLSGLDDRYPAQAFFGTRDLVVPFLYSVQSRCPSGKDTAR